MLKAGIIPGFQFLSDSDKISNSSGLKYNLKSDFEIQHEFVPQTGKSNKNSIFTGLKRNSILITL